MTQWVRAGGGSSPPSSRTAARARAAAVSQRALWANTITNSRDRKREYAMYDKWYSSNVKGITETDRNTAALPASYLWVRRELLVRRHDVPNQHIRTQLDFLVSKTH